MGVFLGCRDEARLWVGPYAHLCYSRHLSSDGAEKIFAHNHKTVTVEVSMLSSSSAARTAAGTGAEAGVEVGEEA